MPAKAPRAPAAVHLVYSLNGRLMRLTSVKEVPRKENRMTPVTKAMMEYDRNTTGRDIITLRFESIKRPSPPMTCGGLSRSVLIVKIAKRVDAIEQIADIIATKPAMRAMLSKPDKERNVTDALRTIDAMMQVHAPMTNMGAADLSPPSSSTLRTRERSIKK